jgi:hypothetical protein
VRVRSDGSHGRCPKAILRGGTDEIVVVGPWLRVNAACALG